MHCITSSCHPCLSATLVSSSCRRSHTPARIGVVRRMDLTADYIRKERPVSLEGRAAQNIAATDRRHTLLPGEPVSALRLSLLQADIVALCILIRSTAGGGLCSAGALQSCEFWRNASMLCLLSLWARMCVLISLLPQLVVEMAADSWKRKQSLQLNASKTPRLDTALIARWTLEPLKQQVNASDDVGARLPLCTSLSSLNRRKVGYKLTSYCAPSLTESELPIAPSLESGPR